MDSNWTPPTGSVTEGWVSAPQKIAVQNGALLSAGPSRRRRISSEILEDFLDVGRAANSEAAVLRFAKRYGTLQLCRHGLPMFHSHTSAPFTGRAGECSEIKATGEYNYHEPVAKWLEFARQAQAVVNVAEAIRRSGEPDPDDLDNLLFRGRDRQFTGQGTRTVEVLSRYGVTSPISSPRRVYVGFVEMVVEQWTRYGRIRPYLHWRGDRWAITFTTGPVSSTFGAIAGHLMLAVAGESGLSICHNCGMSYPVKRRPNPNRRNYCEDCAGAASRDSKREERARRKPGANRCQHKDARGRCQLPALPARRLCEKHAR